MLIFPITRLASVSPRTSPQSLAHGVGYRVQVLGAAQGVGGVAGQVPAGCPVAVRFAAAWDKLTPMRWTNPAARISSISACRSDP
jgi:hypothetical protein